MNERFDLHSGVTNDRPLIYAGATGNDPGYEYRKLQCRPRRLKSYASQRRAGSEAGRPQRSINTASHLRLLTVAARMAVSVGQLRNEPIKNRKLHFTK